MRAASIILKDVWRARKRIAPIVRQTPLIHASELSELVGTNVYLKLENLNVSGSFKIRGAANKILSLTSEEQRQGITTFSTGNFGMSVAYVAKQLGIHATICISRRVPNAKVVQLKQSGTNIDIDGDSQDEAEQRSYRLEKEHGMTVIHPFDDPYVIAGQGTIGLELLNELPEVDTVIGGLSGGGLHSGLGIAMKETDINTCVFGLSTTRGAAMHASIRAGEPVVIEEKDTLADSLLGGIGMDNCYTFDLVQRYVDDIMLLNEEEFAHGMAFMFQKHRMAIEGAAASGIGAILHGKVPLGNHVVVVVSGSSVDTSVLSVIADAHKQS